jgi:hypothetical protein
MDTMLHSMDDTPTDDEASAPTESLAIKADNAHFNCNSTVAMTKLFSDRATKRKRAKEARVSGKETDALSRVSSI